MLHRQSTARRPVFSASAVMDAIADALTTIKREDGLTDADIGRVLGKSEDQAAKYRTSQAEMGIVAFSAAQREWGARFTAPLDQLCQGSRPQVEDDQATLVSLLDLGVRMATAMNDGHIDAHEVRANLAQLSRVRDQLDALISKAGEKEQGLRAVGGAA